MAQSVSNDALWEKLSEMNRKPDKLSEVQRSPVLNREQTEIIPYFIKVKEEIMTEIKAQASLLGKHSDIVLVFSKPFPTLCGARLKISFSSISS